MDLAKKIIHERFRWHNFQWLELMTGESLYEEENQEIDEDYLDPRYLHTAAELYDSDLYYEMQSQLESAHGSGGYHMEVGRNVDIEDDVDFPGAEDGALSSMQYPMMMNPIPEHLSMYTGGMTGSRMEYGDEREVVSEGFEEYDTQYGRGLYGSGSRYDGAHIMEDYSDHPAFANMSTHEYDSVTAVSRPPTRYGF